MRSFVVGVVVLLALYATAATVALVYDDQRYHTILFAPVPSGGWHAPKYESCEKQKATDCVVSEYVYPDCQKFNPVQCWLYPGKGEAYRVLEYDTEDLKVEVRSSDLGLPGRGPAERDLIDGIYPHSPPAGKVQMFVTITGLKEQPIVDPSKIRVVGPCGPDVKQNRNGTYSGRAEEFWTLNSTTEGGRLELLFAPKTFQGQVLVDADRSSLQECTLRLRDAVAGPSAGKIPDVTFRSTPVAFYDVITAE